MEISINQQSITIPENFSVGQLLSTLSLQSPKGMAVAVNQVIVSKLDWSAHQLRQGDDVILIKATQGG